MKRTSRNTSICLEVNVVHSDHIFIRCLILIQKRKVEEDELSWTLDVELAARTNSGFIVYEY